MKYNELGDQLPELAKQKKALQDELFGLSIKLRTNQLTQKHKIRDTRRDLARIETKISSLTKSSAGAKTV